MYSRLEVRELPLTQGKVTLVDADVYEWASKYKWNYCGGYAARWVYRDDGTRVIEYLHKRILSTPKGMDTDHINFDKLDNRRTNLRPATRSQNQAYRAAHKGNTSGYVGVSRKKETGRWYAYITRNRVRVHIGYFDCPVEAARARDAKALELFEEFAYLNFPLEKGNVQQT